MIRVIFCFSLFIINLLNSQGQITFQKTFHEGMGRSVIQTYDGGFLLSGSTTSFNGNSAVMIIKTDTFGDTLWTKIYGNPNPNIGDFAKCIRQTIDSGYIVLTSGDIFNHPSLIKLNAIGDSVWTNSLEILLPNLNSIIQSGDGGYLITGSVDWFGNGDIAVIKTDSFGNILWSKISGDNFSSEMGLSLVECYNGDVVVTGKRNGILIQNMNTGYYKSYEGSDGSCIRQTSDSGFIVVGSTVSPASRIAILKFDPNLQLQWVKKVGNINNDAQGSSCRQTIDGGYIILGSYYSSGQNDILVIKTDSNGDTLWTRLYGTPFNEYAFEIQQTTDSGYIIVGSSGPDIYLLKIDSSGSLGCNENNISLTIGNAISQTFSIGQDTMIPINNAGSTFLEARGISISDPCNLAGIINISEFDKPFSVFPNPFNYFINLKFTEQFKPTTELKLFNVIGEKLIERKIITENQLLDLSFLPDGCYFISIKADTNVFTEKILKCH